jgi:hypothetical protein
MNTIARMTCVAFGSNLRVNACALNASLQREHMILSLRTSIQCLRQASTMSEVLRATIRML